MNGLPYYKRYPRDFIEGTIGMPFELKAAYSFVLDLIYMQGGNLPDDSRYISGLLGLSTRRWNLIRKELIDLGKLVVSGDFLTNYRALSELESSRKFQDNQREKRSRPNKNNDLQSPQSHHARDLKPEPDTKKKEPKGSKKIIVQKPDGVTDQVWEDFKKLRQAKRAPITQTAMDRIQSEAEKVPCSLAAAIKLMVEKGWQGFKADWVKPGDIPTQMNGHKPEPEQVIVSQHDDPDLFDFCISFRVQHDPNFNTNREHVRVPAPLLETYKLQKSGMIQ